MNLYLDSSALVKRYVQERGTDLVLSAMEAAVVVGTSLMTGAESPAALARVTAMGVATEEQARQNLARFWVDWQFLVRVPVDELLIRQAADLAWRLQLRGYDAVHLASCCAFAESLREPVVLATFDRQLARAARELGMDTLPDDIDQHLGRSG
ncbi:MAG: type II toxin-antitoxin system VapC family toxin [Anaerolineae bacterium]